MSRPEDFVGPYDHIVCHFCGDKPAAYERPENSNPRGKKFPSCFKCCREYKPEQPAQLQAAKP